MTTRPDRGAVRPFRFAFEGRPVTWKRPRRPGGPTFDDNANAQLGHLSNAFVAARNVYRLRFNRTTPLFEVPVAVRLWFHFATRGGTGFVYLDAEPFDATIPGTIRGEPLWSRMGAELEPYAGTADADNLEKLVLDAGTLAGVWDNDRRVRYTERLVTQSPNARELYQAAEAFAVEVLP